ncbi:FG-GAP repeat protein [Collimonas sp. PA-H2]|uniref:FG-GAP repeat protein n=1 Tax=Collimonas sp. PA-H2 TaxID=1881062 RepID=UPI0013046D52|nr:FG-GAP repeat protein [Collimonas sp. PA-H2]
MRFLLMPTLLSALTFLTIAHASTFPNLTAFKDSISANTDKAETVYEATGDLNGDGLDDFALIVRRNNGEAVGLTQQLYVLLQIPSGGYVVAEKTAESYFLGGGCCYVESMEIRNSSIYIQTNFIEPDGGSGATTNQFKLYKGVWKLVGMKRFYHEPGGVGKETQTDTNALTGSVIEKTQISDNKLVIRNRKVGVSPRYLRDFDFDADFGITGRKEPSQ